MNKILAFVKKDFLIFISYKVLFVTQILESIMTVLVFFFISKLFGTHASSYLKPYGGEYFPFVLLGVSFFTYLSTTLSVFSQKIRSEQMAGTLEAIFTTPTKFSTILVSSASWSFILSSFTAFIHLSFGFLLFSPDLANINIIVCILIIILSLVSFSAIGMISGSFIILFKMGNPLNWVIRGVTSLLGGVYYPVEVLPQALKNVSLFLPITYSLRALRGAVFSKLSFMELSGDIFMLFVFCVVLLPVSIIFFNYAVARTKREGRLGFY